MSNNELNMSVRERGLVKPRVFWEKAFFFDGTDGHYVIYGYHCGGGFFAIPNLNICCEASVYGNATYWNRDSLMGAGVREAYARAIAEFVNDYNIEHGDEIYEIIEEEDERRGAYYAACGLEIVYGQYEGPFEAVQSINPDNI